MKITVIQNTVITRYAGTYSSFSAFFMAAGAAVADSERVSVRGTGEGEFTPEGMRLSYREEAEDGARPSVTFDLRGEELRIRRGGSEMCFVRGKTTRFSYSVGYGYLPMEVYTEALTVQEKDRSRLLSLSYLSITDGMASRTEIRFKVTVAE